MVCSTRTIIGISFGAYSLTVRLLPFFNRKEEEPIESGPHG
jgi:hypothetical protein